MTVFLVALVLVVIFYGFRFVGSLAAGIFLVVAWLVASICVLLYEGIRFVLGRFGIKLPSTKKPAPVIPVKRVYREATLVGREYEDGSREYVLTAREEP